MPSVRPAEPRARVFISCGQMKGSDEVMIASKIRDRIEVLGFDPYIAVDVMQDQAPVSFLQLHGRLPTTGVESIEALRETGRERIRNGRLWQ